MAPLASRASSRGFSFLEILVVMGAMAVLMGLTVGYFSQIGTATQLSQARNILVETARRCQSASVGGGQRAVMTLQKQVDEDGVEVLKVGAAVAQTVLTHQFETLGDVSDGLPVEVSGVQLAHGEGYTGSAGKFETQSYLELPPQSAFAMTEGFEFDARIKPAAGRQHMTLIEGLTDDGAMYRVSLVKARGGGANYDVDVKLKVREPGRDPRESSGDDVQVSTTGGFVRAGAGWQRVEASWRGLDVSIRVNGLDLLGGQAKGAASRRRHRGKTSEEENAALRMFAVPASGAVRVRISSPNNAYEGLMDTVQLRGVFRSKELQRVLPEALQMLSPAPPVRIAFRGGVLDPSVHDRSVVLRFVDTAKPDDPPMALRVGTNGTVESRIEVQRFDEDASAGGAGQ